MKGNIHNFFLLQILAILFASCTTNRIKIEEMSPKSALVNKIRKEVFVKLLVEDLLHPCGTSAQMMDEIKMLGFWFNHYHEIDIDDARKLLIKAVDVALTKINSCEEIIPYLINSPFIPQNIEITIFLRNPDGSNLEEEKIRAITLREGSIRYKNGIKDSRGFQTILFEETYEEAKANLGKADKRTMRE